MSQSHDRRSLRPLLIVTTLMIALLFVALWWSGGAAVDATAGPPAKALVAAELTTESKPVSGSARSELAKDPESDPRKGPGVLAGVRGRCLAAETKEPLAGCLVRFSGSRSNAEVVARHGSTAWEQPDPVTTGPDGRFEIRFAAMPPFQHSLDIRADGRAPRTARWGAFQPGEVDDLGDIDLQIGHVVTGRVVDTTGAPVRRGSVDVGRLPLPIRDDMAANDSRAGFLDEHGAFEIRVPVPRGTWLLRSSCRGFQHVGPASVVVPLEEPLRVVVRRLPVIRGYCVDEQGQPMAKVYVGTKVPSGIRQATAWSRKDGSFELYCRSEKVAPVRIMTSRGDGDPLVTKRAFAWGTSDVRLVLRRSLKVVVKVIEKGSRLPVEEFAVECRHHPRAPFARGLRLGGRHAGGKVIVDHVVRGKNQLIIVPKDPNLRMVAPVEFTAADPAVPDLEVELVRLAVQEILVEDRSGTPQIGSKVELVDSPPEGLRANMYLHSVAKMLQGGDHSFPRLLGVAYTDDQGVARIGVPPEGLNRLGLRVSGSSHVTTIVRELSREGKHWRVVVDRGGCVLGRLITKGFAPESLRVQAEGRDGTRVPVGNDGVVPVTTDGRFRIEGLPPSDVLLTATIRSSVKTDSGGSSSWGALPLPPTVVSLGEGEEREIEIDVTSCAPARVEGQLFVDGEPGLGTRVYLRARKNYFMFGELSPDSQGRFVFEQVVPGTYALGIVFPKTRRRVHYDRLIEVEPGAVVRHVAQIQRRKVRVRIVTTEGQPMAKLHVAVKTPVMGDSEYRSEKTDAAGWLELDPAPASRVILHSRGGKPFPVIELTGDPRELELQRTFIPVR